MTDSNNSVCTIAVVGRPNVGKSTLFNRLVGRRSSIVHDMPGVTRDRTYGLCEWQGRTVRVIDTGGMVDETDSPLLDQMQAQVRAAIEESDVVLFIVDVSTGPTAADERIAGHLRKLGKPVYLVSNKADNIALSSAVTEFYSLGFGTPYPVSALHGSGVADLLDLLLNELPDAPTAPEPDDDSVRVAVIGRPNAGKSSFINALLREDRVVVDDEPGTTRDAVDVRFEWNNQHYTLIDTAGMRRRSRIRQSVEQFSVSRAIASVRRSQVCVLMADVTTGVVDQDVRIAEKVFSEGRGLVLVLNKWDTVENKESRFKEIIKDVRRRSSLFSHVPFVTTSCTERQRLFDVLCRVDEVYQSYKTRIDTGELNRFFGDALADNPPPVSSGRRGKLYYVTQAESSPPTFVLFVNTPGRFSATYIRYLENTLRKRYGFSGVPIRIEVRES